MSEIFSLIFKINLFFILKVFNVLIKNILSKHITANKSRKIYIFFISYKILQINFVPVYKFFITLFF